jgi:hypothetical protein
MDAVVKIIKSQLPTNKFVGLSLVSTEVSVSTTET